MDIKDFRIPEQHPYGMLRGYDNACEKEQLLSIILARCIRVGKFMSIKTMYNHPVMVNDGLLKKVDDKKYKLTKKAIGLLYSQYAK